MEWILAFIVGAGMGAGLVWCSLVPSREVPDGENENSEAYKKFVDRPIELNAVGWEPLVQTDWPMVAALAADEKPTEGCECDWESYRPYAEMFHRCTRGRESKDCPVHFPKGAK